MTEHPIRRGTVVAEGPTHPGGARRYTVNVLVREKGERWIAQCREYDIAAQGKSFDDAVDALGRALVGQIFVDLMAGKTPFDDCPAPPAEVEARFVATTKPPNSRPVEIPTEVANRLSPGVTSEMLVYAA
ncbi:MAG TPA: hypothetical protein VH062_24130 [Polyangiaceae bacterium]|jgi:hypothetical protein|nr:hypothetical protein [Polyangiaceae bacterium]